MIRRSSLPTFALSIAVLLVLSTSSTQAQEPIPGNLQPDTLQIQPVPNLQQIPGSRRPSGSLVLADTFLQNIDPASLTRVGPNQVETDTSVAPQGDDLSIDVGKVAVISNGSKFRKSATAAGPSQPTARNEPVLRAPSTWVSNPSSGSPTRGTLLMKSTQRGFVMSDEPGVFKTTLQIWLASENGGSGPSLASPTDLIVSVDDAVSIEPSPLEMTQFNDVTSVNVEAETARDSLSVSVSLPSQHSPPHAVLDVRRPELDVSATPSRIEGFGLGESTVQVPVPDSYPGPARLSAATQSATAMPATQKVVPGTAGTFTIRSWGVGEETIRIEGGSFADAGRSVTVRFVWPVYFLLFALGGSLVGGGIRYYRR